MAGHHDPRDMRKFGTTWRAGAGQSRPGWRSSNAAQDLTHRSECALWSVEGSTASGRTLVVTLCWSASPVDPTPVCSTFRVAGPRPVKARTVLALPGCHIPHPVLEFDLVVTEDSSGRPIDFRHGGLIAVLDVAEGRQATPRATRRLLPRRLSRGHGVVTVQPNSLDELNVLMAADTSAGRSVSRLGGPRRDTSHPSRGLWAMKRRKRCISGALTLYDLVRLCWSHVVSGKHCGSTCQAVPVTGPAPSYHQADRVDKNAELGNSCPASGDVRRRSAN